MTFTPETASAIERNTRGKLNSFARASAAAALMSKIPATGKLAFAYAGKCASRTMPPAPMSTIGFGSEGRGQVCWSCRRSLLTVQELCLPETCLDCCAIESERGGVFKLNGVTKRLRVCQRSEEHTSELQSPY